MHKEGNEQRIINKWVRALGPCLLLLQSA